MERAGPVVRRDVAIGRVGEGADCGQAFIDASEAIVAAAIAEIMGCDGAAGIVEKRSLLGLLPVLSGERA